MIAISIVVVMLVVTYIASIITHRSGEHRFSELKSDAFLSVLNPCLLVGCVAIAFDTKRLWLILIGVLAEIVYAVYLIVMRKKVNVEAHISNSFLVLLLLAIIYGALYLFS